MLNIASPHSAEKPRLNPSVVTATMERKDLLLYLSAHVGFGDRFPVMVGRKLRRNCLLEGNEPRIENKRTKAQPHTFDKTYLSLDSQSGT